MRYVCLTGIGAVGSVIASALGGWDFAIQTLVIFMVIDYLTGLTVAAVFKKSRKSESGAFDSNAGYEGLIKKCMMLLMVVMAYRLDGIIGWDFTRTALVFVLIINESGSIIENASIMGVPIPRILRQAIEFLRKKAGEEDDNSEDIH